MTKAQPNKKSSASKSAGAKKPAARKPVADAGSADLPTATGAPSSLDESSGAAALARLQPRLLAVPADRPLLIRFNVRMGAAAGMGLVQLITEHNLRPRFAALAQAGFFDMAHLDGLGELAQALWYLRHRLDEQTALRSRATLPAALVQEVGVLRRRMLRVLVYRFEEDPAITARLDYIRRGSGHQDLADDLMRLAGLYDQQKAVLAGTPSPYDAKDQERAAHKAVEILHLLGLGPDLDKTGARTPTAAYDFGDLQRRAATLFERSYEKVATAGRFICQDDAALVARFAPLGSIARSRPSVGGKSDAAEGEEPADAT